MECHPSRCRPGGSRRSCLRALERAFASKRMRAFSTPPGCLCPTQSGGDRCEENDPDPGRQNGGVARVAADDEASFSDVFPSESSETSSTLEAEWGMEPALVPGGPTPSAASLLQPHCLPSESKLEKNRGASNVSAHERGRGGCSAGEGVVDSPEATLMMPQVFDGGAIDDAENHDIGAADWLDVTHALLDGAPGPD